jgi:hypothetical protein
MLDLAGWVGAHLSAPAQLCALPDRSRGRRLSVCAAAARIHALMWIG